MNDGEPTYRRLVDDELTVEVAPRVRRGGGRGTELHSGPDDDPARRKADEPVDVTDGLRVDPGWPVDGASVAPPSLPPSAPVLGATLRPPLIGAGPSGSTPSARPTLRGEALRDALGAPDTFPPSPYLDENEPFDGTDPVEPFEHGDHSGRHAGLIVPTGPQPVDPQEQELWFHPRVEPATDPATVAISLPLGRDTSPEASLGHAQDGAEPLSAVPAPPPARPNPREVSSGTVAPDDEGARSGRRLSRRARRAAEHADAAPSGDVSPFEPLAAPDRAPFEPSIHESQPYGYEPGTHPPGGYEPGRYTPEADRSSSYQPESYRSDPYQPEPYQPASYQSPSSPSSGFESLVPAPSEPSPISAPLRVSRQADADSGATGSAPPSLSPMRPPDDELPDLVDADEWVELPEYARPASAALRPAPLPPLPVPPVGPSSSAGPSSAAGPATVPGPPVLSGRVHGFAPVGAPPAPVTAGPPPILGQPSAPVAPPSSGSPFLPPPAAVPPIPPAPAPSAYPMPSAYPAGPAYPSSGYPQSGYSPPPAYPSPPAAASPSGPAGLFPAPSPSVDVPPSGGPGGAPAPSAPVTGPVEAPARSPRSVPGPSTASIPVIRPPVPVRRPDDADSATAETRSLRVTPPDAKALFRTPVAPKTGDSGPPDGWASPSGTLGPVATNVAPPIAPPAPGRPVAPKSQVSADDADVRTGTTRRVVVIPGSGPGSAAWTPSSAVPPAPPAPSEAAAPAVPPPTALTPGSGRSPVPAPPAADGGPGPFARPAAPGSPVPTDGPAPFALPPGRSPQGPAGDPAMADWLGELRGDDDPPFPGQQDDVQPPWGTGFGADQAPAASTVVPLRGRQARQQRKAEEKARKAQAQAEIKAVKAAGRDRSAGREGAGRMPALDPVPPAFESDGRYHQVDDDLDEAGRGRWVSVLVFWAPALILLLLAGVVIWLVR